VKRSTRLISWIEPLPVTKGHLTRQRMKLMPAQKQFIRKVYDNPQIRLAVLSAPRGSGKAGLAAGLCLAHLMGTKAIQRGETYSAAIDRGRAVILHREMVAIAKPVEGLAARIRVSRHFKRIEVLDGPGSGSTYEALSNDARRGHGLAPSFWIYDELGQAKDRELLEALTTAMASSRGRWVS
jgi:phage terminase large subunit-like protein